MLRILGKSGILETGQRCFAKGWHKEYARRCGCLLLPMKLKGLLPITGCTGSLLWCGKWTKSLTAQILRRSYSLKPPMYAATITGAWLQPGEWESEFMIWEYSFFRVGKGGGRNLGEKLIQVAAQNMRTVKVIIANSGSKISVVCLHR